MRERTARKVAMSDKWLRELLPPAPPPDAAKTAIERWWDSESPLIAKVSSRGTKSLLTYYRNKDGVLRWYTIGKAPPWKIADARDVAAEVRKRAALNEDPHQQKIEARRRYRELVSFEQLVRRYLAAADVRQRVRDLDQYQRRLEADVLPDWRSWKAEDITRDDAKALINRIAERSRGTARLTMYAASAVFTWAIGNDIIKATNPFSSLAVPALRKAEGDDRSRVFTPEEIRGMWLAFGDDDAGRALKLMLLTGARRTEAAELPWGEITGREWNLPRSRSKNKQAHTFWLSEPAMKLIGKPAGEMVFPGGSKAAIDARWGEVKKAAGIDQHEEGAQVRDLRRTFQTGIAEHVDEPWLADMLTNHVKKGMAKIYDKAKHKARMARAWDEWARIVTEQIVKGLPIRDDNLEKFPGAAKTSSKARA